MDILPLLCIVSVAFTGLTKGAGVLPNGTLNAAVGKTVMFNVTMTPPEPIQSVNWRFGHKDIFTFGATNTTGSGYEGRITFFMSTGSLELRNVALSDSGEYRVTIVTPSGSFQHGDTTLKVYEPISNVIATANSTQLVEFNSSVRLSCSSSGSPLSFLWMNSSSQVTVSDRVQLTDGGSNLTIVNVTRYDQGPFRCGAFNLVSNDISDREYLNISYGPENTDLTISPSQQYFVVGSNITLSCSADSRPAAIFYWFLNGSKLPDTGAELRLMNINMNQSGSYSCQVFNQKTLRYETSQPSAVSVLARVANVVVTSNPADLVEFSSSVSLSCSSSGSMLSFFWLNSSSEVTESDRVQLTDGNSTLTILNVTRNDQGFRCRVSNPVSNFTSDPVNLNISYGPENTNLAKSPSQEHYEEGADITLTCSAVSNPSALFNWFLNGSLQSHTGRKLRLMNIQMSHSGKYSCQAFNQKTLRYQTSQPSVVSVLESDEVIPDPPPPCPAGCIAGIVIAVLVVCGAAAGGGGYYMYRKKNYTNRSSPRNTTSRTRGEGQDNTGHSGSQDVNYADVSFFRNKEGGIVQISPNETSEYAQVRVNNNPPAASSPPSYDVHMKRQAPQPGANGTDTYAQVRKT